MTHSSDNQKPQYVIDIQQWCQVT